MPPGSRAGAGPLAVVALLALAVCLAAVVASAAVVSLPHPVRPTVVHLDAHADGRVTLTLRGGGPLDARRLGVRVAVDGVPLTDQPPVPFFAADGFRGGPRGPFNAHADPRWTAGELAGLRVAHTNHPYPRRGDRVTVTLYVGTQRVAIAHARVT